MAKAKNTIIPQPISDKKPDTVVQEKTINTKTIEMSQDHYNMMDDIINMKDKLVGTYEVKLMQIFGQTYINQDLHICSHCDAQIRLAYAHITNWITDNKEYIIIK